VVHVDAAVLADPEQAGQTALEGGIRVSAETSRRLACDARSTIATRRVASRAAGGRSERATTCSTGPTGARPCCPT
jgi:hypothetical protein